MSEQSVQTPNETMPPPPEGVTDVDRIAGAEDRWANCPLKDCKRDPELLYQDFYLRGIRSNRLLCSACAQRVEMGYMAREEVRKSDDRFFTGSQADNLLVAGVMFAGSVLANALMLVIGFWFLAFFVGGAVGAGLAGFARRLTKGRVTRQMPYFAMGGIVLGALIAPTLYFLVRFGVFFFDIGSAFNLSIIICSGMMASGAWGIFLRRI
ncbi:MAG: hypothetical protein AAFR81_16575 [Chloroflexota bacterium]